MIQESYPDQYDKLTSSIASLNKYEKYAIMALYDHPDIKHELSDVNAYEVLTSGIFEDYIEDYILCTYSDFEEHVKEHSHQFVDMIRNYKKEHKS